MKVIQLPEGKVDLWWATTDNYSTGQSTAILTLLNEEERRRYDAFRVSSARIQFLAARALLRMTLSRYHNSAPNTWYFNLNAYGRPSVCNNLAATNLHFSVSHTDGMVACAVGHFSEFGIDVERLDRHIDVAEMLLNVLAPSEIAQLNDMPEDKRSEHFLLLWTLKEAYVKARSMGLSLPMNGVAFDLTGERPRSQFAGTIVDDPLRWTFQHFSPTPKYTISIAAALPQGKLKLQLYRTNVFNRV